jgi:hypothetical protein
MTKMIKTNNRFNYLKNKIIIIINNYTHIKTLQKDQKYQI